ncbi:TolC family protein [Acidovorax sp.]|uniref:TolC family protein n=1 Tax=Acidovorax sp. TaxID=1872122 RepID=UPI00391F9B6B
MNHLLSLSMSHTQKPRLRMFASPLRLATLSCLPVLLAACGSVTPVSLTQNEIEARVTSDRKAIYAGQEPVTAPITFHEASARALKYNLDYRLKLMENALAKNLADSATYEMLPRLVAGAGYASRNNDSGGSSIGIQDRIESLRPSTSQERDRTLANLTFSWNVLDFGVSYYRAQQKADQFLMAEERRRKVAQNVLQDVRNSYWRALGAQKLIGRGDALLARVNTALAQARQVEKEGLMPQSQVLAYQRALLDAVNLLTLRRQELELARAELTALMSIPPGTAYTLADEQEIALPPTPTNIEALERMALEKRPELLEESYRKRVTENDIKAAKLLLWPNLSVDAGPSYDSNKYNYNSNWVDVGVRLSWNVLKLAQLPALERAHKAQNETDDLRRMALSMAVLTQVRVGVQRYDLALSELKFSEESLAVDSRLLSFSQKAAKTQFDSRLEVIRAEARALLAEYQRYATYSNAQAAWGRLYNSVGLDVLPQAIASHDVQSLARAMETTTSGWQAQVFKTGTATAPGAGGQ